MRVKVVLHSVLREKLPHEAQGVAYLELGVGGRLSNVLEHFGIEYGMCAVNGQLERDSSRSLQDGDEVRVFARVAGG